MGVFLFLFFFHRTFLFSLLNSTTFSLFTSGLKLLALDELVQSKPCLVYKYESNRHLTAAYNKQLLLLKTDQ